MIESAQLPQRGIQSKNGDTEAEVLTSIRKLSLDNFKIIIQYERY